MFSATLRRAIKMSSTTSSAPFSKAVTGAMRKLYPEALADKSWDNTGLLLESPFDPIRRQMNSALLTIDLTKAVADEAIERGDSIIVAYHPIIFRGLKSLSLADTQQQTLLRLAAEGISVYSPHTAIDCAPGGLGDWLADIVSGTPMSAEELAAQAEQKQEELSNQEPETPSQQLKRPTFQLQHHPSQLSIKDRTLKLGNDTHTRRPIKPSSVPGYQNTTAGMGRIVRFNTPQPLLEIIDRIGRGLGNPKGFPIAIPQGKTMDEIDISSVAICAGSGGGVFGGLGKNGEEDVDLLFTGELSHHEALAAIEQGKCVIALFHSNTERGFLHGVLKPQLEKSVKEEWERVRKEEKGKAGLSEDYLEALEDDHVEIHVSEVDRDPYGIMISKDEI
ncbi:NGG1p interacting factor 3 [Aureobasidium pullulans]|uniref:NGG1p interacting factor 3 n=1 Tax=Aureobasidium pullulans TaxID=5580 RepID=A0A4S9CBZ5_AURPU|nr:NGG1p interacting factor 3 [Aureobasidium pullulans]THW21532.1 NGG1p interacting factor 3 [Aureobasidium pullulans]THW79118.1 NGG1p interacting factor 3 [Aureobasidium pullulans]THW96562.1 NGG1p interacting factor 3 [Aureobasidium pullulans]THX04209.1 NGG1p interacting factor 3 [Aureobasidium pullulans]